ncbi:bifunctional DNA primase/polymerase [Streptomyces zhihengii]|uniref:Bifunctional DNA primase/polymerase n=1 Tax=Streptomyces zhihengii TaxID=1818004 RepID=A0ABS2V3S2_9ACTN|nr:bifunctional DNA primase/polymerase [Streptomyces zhihengii]MBM9624487.1 bifunctional DNA primase/polymerase [Streptomyces zhihengii]
MARWFAAQQWPVHPLAPGRKTPIANCESCRTRSHEPAECPCHPEGRWCHGFHSATTNPATIDRWWALEPRAGIGVSCGPAHLIVLDVDAHAAQVPARARLLPGIPIPDRVNLDGLASGFDTLALLAAYRREQNPAEDATTLRVRTPSGGMHVWYTNPRPEIRYRSSTGSSLKAALAWQVDIRAHGGYIVAPTTRTSAGSYLPLGAVRRPASLPAWLAADLERTGHVVQSVPFPRSRQRIRSRSPQLDAARALLQPLLEAIRECGARAEGTSFTEKLNRAAYTAGGLASAGHLDQDNVRHQLVDAARYARPHQDRRSEMIIDAALAAGASRPFHPKGLA